MKKFNLTKVILGLFTVLTVALLAACGQGKEEARYFQKIDQNSKVDIQITYYYKGDDVTRQTTHTTLYYSALGSANKETVKAQFDPISAKYQDIDGVKEKITYNDDHFVEDVDVDFTKVDFKKLAEVDSTFGNSGGGSAKKISMKSSAELLEKNGFKEVKDGKFESLK